MRIKGRPPSVLRKLVKAGEINALPEILSFAQEWRPREEEPGRDHQKGIIEGHDERISLHRLLDHLVGFVERGDGIGAEDLEMLLFAGEAGLGRGIENRDAFADAETAVPRVESTDRAVDWAAFNADLCR